MSENHFYGWYDDATQAADQPSHDPPHDAPCLWCGKRLEPNDVRSISVMFAGPVYAKRSYFYRVHKTCDEREKAQSTDLDTLIFDMIARNGD